MKNRRFGWMLAAAAGWMLAGLLVLPALADVADRMKQGIAYFDEKSWELARAEFEQVAGDDSATAAQKREAAYRLGECLVNLQRAHEAAPYWGQVADGGIEDEWAARAMGRLEQGMNGEQWMPSTSAPLERGRAAWALMTKLDMEERRGYAFELLQWNHRRAQTDENRAFLLKLVEDVSPLCKNDEERARLLFNKAYITHQPETHNAEGRKALFDALAQVPQEFGGTLASADALLAMAQMERQQGDFVATVKTLRRVTDEHRAHREQARIAREQIDFIQAENVEFGLAGQYLPGEKIEFVLAARNVGEARLRVLKVDPLKWARNQGAPGIEGLVKEGKEVRAETLRVPKRDDYLATTRPVSLSDIAPGVYVIEVRAGKATAQGLAVVSNLSLVTNGGGSEVRFWTVDAKSGAPRKDVAITAALDPEYVELFGIRVRKFGQIRSLTSDGEGFAILKRETAGGEVLVVAQDGDDVALGGTNYYFYRSGRWAESFQAYLYTDRPVYRPEQKVHWRALVWKAKDGEFTPGGGEKYTVTVRDPRGEEVKKYESVAANEFGAIEGELDLVVRAPLGAYQIQIATQDNNQHVGNGSFRVEEYKKPEYEVTVTAADDLYRLGAKVGAKVEARYLFGAAVQEADVSYTVRRTPRWFLPFRSVYQSRFGWFDWGQQNDQQWYRGQRSGDIVASGTGKTDAEGVFKFEFDAKEPPEAAEGRQGRNYRWWWQGNAYDFSVEATVVDKSRRNIDGRQVIVVSDRALQLGVSPARSLYTPGDKIEAVLNARNVGGKPVAAKGDLYLLRVKWTGGDDKEEVTTVSVRQVAVDDSGESRVEWQTGGLEAATYRLHFAAEDPFEGMAEASATVVLADETTEDVYFKFRGLEVVPDREAYEVGDTAKLLLLCDLEDAQAWMWVDAGTGLPVSRLVPLPKRTNTLELPITKGFAPNVQLNVVVVKDRRLYHVQKELLVPPSDQIVNVEIVPDKADYRPGETLTAAIRATDRHGKPVEGEFSLAAFDQAILYIAPDDRQDIRAAFYGSKRPASSNVAISSTFAPGFRFLTQVPGEFRRALPDDGSVGQEFWSTSVDMMEANGVSSRQLAFGRSELAMGIPAPASAPAMEMVASRAASAGDVWRVKNGAARDKSGEMAAGGRVEEMAAPADLRTDFRDSAYWSPAVRTDGDGRAKVSFTLPDSLTTWRLVAVGSTQSAAVGEASVQRRATKNLLVRLQAPRFFRQYDSLVVSTIVNNQLASEAEVTVRLTINGLTASGETLTSSALVKVPAGSDLRTDWPVEVGTWGTVTIKAEALSREESDALEMTFPALPHGMDKFVAWNGSTDMSTTGGVEVTRGADGVTIVQTIEIPAERLVSSSKLVVSIKPSLASAVRDALPYMIDYPYGCVEQTMSRFMPAAIAAKTFGDLGIPMDRATQEKLADVTAKGLQRLADFQKGTGAWGWWRDDDENLYLSAYVVHGLTLAREADVPVDANMLSRGVTFLRTRAADHEDWIQGSPGYWRHNNLNGLNYALFALALNNERVDGSLDYVYERRSDLPALGLAYLARTLHKSGRTEDAQVVLRNLQNFVVRTPENGTARWGRLRDAWYWWHDAVESTAAGLEAFLEISPDDPLVTESMKWLALNRKGNRWKSTKDSAFAVLALTSYMRAKGEASRTQTFEVSVGEPGTPEHVTKKFELTPSNFWEFAADLTLAGDAVPTGKFPVTIRQSGDGLAFYSVMADYYTLERPIAAAGNEIYVTRKYERIVRKPRPAGEEAGEQVETFVPLKDGEAVKSGDELLVTLQIKSLNDYEYLIFEDPKPAGAEPVALQSGTVYGGFCSNMELRDEMVSFFVTHLPQGEHTVTYRCRAEIPGIFHVMPTMGSAMYVPELRANSDEIILPIEDRD